MCFVHFFANCKILSLNFYLTQSMFFPMYIHLLPFIYNCYNIMFTGLCIQVYWHHIIVFIFVCIKIKVSFNCICFNFTVSSSFKFSILINKMLPIILLGYYINLCRYVYRDRKFQLLTSV